jgi:DNA-binding NtrC family response regulator
MPGDMDGVDLAHSIRHSYPGIPIILITGYAEELPGPEFECIRKPFSIEQIVTAVRRAMGEANP